MVSKLKCATKLSKKLGVKRRIMYGGKRNRPSVLSSEKSVFAYTQKKTRSDALSENVRKLAFEFWLRPEVSRPTNNKNDVKRVRLEKNKYSSHSCMILDKTQSEVYQDFKVAHPDIQIGQRTFEKCKPYYVTSASRKDLSTCCCRTHVEIRSLFKTCMSYLKGLPSSENQNVYQTLNELVNDTLCEPPANIRQHKSSCINRLCPDCGVDKIYLFHEGVITTNDECDSFVSWERYEYQNIKHKDGNEIRKLTLVKKTTAPKEMFEYFKELLKKFPSHEFRAKWQEKQLKHLAMNLPIGHCIAVHDYSENYKCIAKEEIQAAYFQKTEVSIHVSVLYRHSSLEKDGIESTEEIPNTVTEHFIVISPDCRHDHHFTHEVQRQVTDYLHSVTDQFHTLHEFTDGCSSQYKSCHCIGDISHSCTDFNLTRVTRNYFETSHGRGPHDAAGGFIKRMADIMAVMRGTHIIQNARDMFHFAEECLENTKDKASCSGRIFRYVDNISRDRQDRYFAPVKENRKIHQVISTEDGTLRKRDLSCFSCEACANARYESCSNDSVLGPLKQIHIKHLNATDTDDGILDSSLADDPVTCELVSPGNIIDVRVVDDERYPYYLLLATSGVVRLRKPYCDKWGATFNAGDEVVHGKYFCAASENVLNQTLIKRIKAAVPARSVVYICNEIEMSNDTIELTDSLHRRILMSLQ